MSQIVLRESTDFDHTSSDDELKDAKYFNNFDKLVKSMLRSGSPVDRRFINFYQTRKADQMNEDARPLLSYYTQKDKFIDNLIVDKPVIKKATERQGSVKEREKQKNEKELPSSSDPITIPEDIDLSVSNQPLIQQEVNSSSY